MIQVTEIAFTGYPVTDMGRARDFYERVLGLKQSKTFEHEGLHWIEYDIGPATIAISNMAPDWKASSTGPAIAFEVADFAVAIAHLRASGVRFYIEPSDTGVCQLAIVSDPDGNSIAIHHRKQH